MVLRTTGRIFLVLAEERLQVYMDKLYKFNRAKTELNAHLASLPNIQGRQTCSPAWRSCSLDKMHEDFSYVNMVSDSTQISEQEAELYYRQIRLWGLDAQKSLRSSCVLCPWYEWPGSGVRGVQKLIRFAFGFHLIYF